MSGDDEEGFLGRWSKRKREAVRPATVSAPLPEAEPPVADEAAPEVAAESDTETDAEILARLDLPDPDTLAQGDDFSRFLNAPLPLHLKRRALRRLWVSNPVLANLDGLNDYDTDFTGGTVAPGMLKTAYKVGRGFLDQVVDNPVEEDPAQTAGKLPPDATMDDSGLIGADAEEDLENETEIISQDGAVELQKLREGGEQSEEPQEFAAVCTKRRMTFRFEG